jgi:hypothetical protein
MVTNSRVPFWGLELHVIDQANENSGLIGAVIVGVFVSIVAGFYVGKWAWGRYGRRRIVLGGA